MAAAFRCGFLEETLLGRCPRLPIFIGSLPFYMDWFVAEFGRAEATMEGLAFPNRPSREPLGAEDV
jgi:hypothetical protein